MASDDKVQSFFSYGISKKWDVSLCVYGGSYMAILSPNDTSIVYIGESSKDFCDAIDECKKQMLKGKK